VTEKHPWNGCLAGVNSFGFGGANAHILLQRNEKEKVNGGAPVDPIPRLVVASGRTEEAVDIILRDVSCTVRCRFFISTVISNQKTPLLRFLSANALTQLAVV